MQKRYRVQYQLDGSNSVSQCTEYANSESEAKEKVKARYKGKVTIISCVEQ